MTLNDPQVQLKIMEWQSELREMTQNAEVILRAYTPIQFVAPDKKLPPEDIIDMVCEETGVPYSQVVTKSRKRDVVITRQLIAFYCKGCCGMSLKSIGELIGKRDHTTVIHSVNTIQDLLDSSHASVCLPVARINKRLEQNQAEA